MAKVDDVISRVGVLETKVNWAGGITSGVLLLWLVWLTHQVNDISGTLKAIRQAEKDRGVDIVGRITERSDPKGQEAAIQLASAELNQALANKTKPDAVKLSKLSAALTQATSQPQVPAVAWQAAATLISYKSAALISFTSLSLPMCDLSHIENLYVFSKENIDRAGIQFTACTFDLNDRQSFDHNEMVRRYKELSGGKPPPTYLLNGVLDFDPSKPMVEIRSMDCVNCLLVVKQEPTDLGVSQHVLRSMLASEGSQLHFVTTAQDGIAAYTGSIMRPSSKLPPYLACNPFSVVGVGRVHRAGGAGRRHL